MYTAIISVNFSMQLEIDLKLEKTKVWVSIFHWFGSEMKSYFPLTQIKNPGEVQGEGSGNMLSSGEHSQCRESDFGGDVCEVA